MYHADGANPHTGEVPPTDRTTTVLATSDPVFVSRCYGSYDTFELEKKKKLGWVNCDKDAEMNSSSRWSSNDTYAYRMPKEKSDNTLSISQLRSRLLTRYQTWRDSEWCKEQEISSAKNTSSYNSGNSSSSTTTWGTSDGGHEPKYHEYTVRIRYYWNVYGVCETHSASFSAFCGVPVWKKRKGEFSNEYSLHFGEITKREDGAEEETTEYQNMISKYGPDTAGFTAPYDFFQYDPTYDGMPTFQFPFLKTDRGMLSNWSAGSEPSSQMMSTLLKEAVFGQNPWHYMVGYVFRRNVPRIVFVFSNEYDNQLERDFNTYVTHEGGEGWSRTTYTQKEYHKGTYKAGGKQVWTDLMVPVDPYCLYYLSNEQNSGNNHFVEDFDSYVVDTNIMGDEEIKNAVNWLHTALSNFKYSDCCGSLFQYTDNSKGEGTKTSVNNPTTVTTIGFGDLKTAISNLSNTSANIYMLTTDGNVPSRLYEIDGEDDNWNDNDWWENNAEKVADSFFLFRKKWDAGDSIFYWLQKITINSSITGLSSNITWKGLQWYNLRYFANKDHSLPNEWATMYDSVAGMFGDMDNPYTRTTLLYGKRTNDGKLNVKENKRKCDFAKDDYGLFVGVNHADRFSNDFEVENDNLAFNVGKYIHLGLDSYKIPGKEEGDDPVTIPGCWETREDENSSWTKADDVCVWMTNNGSPLGGEFNLDCIKYIICYSHFGMADDNSEDWRNQLVNIELNPNIRLTKKGKEWVDKHICPYWTDNSTDWLTATNNDINRKKERKMCRWSLTEDSIHVILFKLVKNGDSLKIDFNTSTCIPVVSDLKWLYSSLIPFPTAVKRATTPRDWVTITYRDSQGNARGTLKVINMTDEFGEKGLRFVDADGVKLRIAMSDVKGKLIGALFTPNKKLEYPDAWKNCLIKKAVMLMSDYTKPPSGFSENANALFGRKTFLTWLKNFYKNLRTALPAIMSYRWYK